MNISTTRLRPISRFWTSLPVFAAVALVLSGLTLPAYGHQHTAPWLDESSLDRGLYVEVRHPRVIRNPGPFDVSVLVNNLMAGEDVEVTEVRYLVPGADAVAHPRQDVLESKSSVCRRYQTVQHELEESAATRNRIAAGRLYSESQSLLLNITSGTFRDRHRIQANLVPQAIGSKFELTVEIDVFEAGRIRTIQHLIEIPVQPPLPRGEGSWLAGDQHLHTAFSIDVFFLDGTSDLVTDYAVTAQMIGLDWIIITDHTNIGFLSWYQPWMFFLVR